jgi:hypothetical protein
VGNVAITFTGIVVTTGKASGVWANPNSITIAPGAIGGLTLTLTSTGGGVWTTAVSLKPS